MVIPRSIALMLVAAIAIAAGCGGNGNGEPATTPSAPAAEPPAPPAETIAVVTHGGVGDAFWDVVKKGAEQAGSDLGLTVTYQGDGNAANQAKLIDAAVSQEVAGLVVSMANPDALEESIRAAVAAGIPVITINSGEDRSLEFGAITHVGQNETVAGEGAGTELQKAGATKLLCIVHEEGNVGLEQRCDGAETSFGGEVERFQVPGTPDVAGTMAQLTAKLQSDESIDGVLSLNPVIAIAARDAIAAAGSAAKLATFDLSGDVVDAILAGEILFAVDQQQYLQGYLPVVFMHLFVTNANTVGGSRPVLTGPGFVTAENAAAVKELAAAGSR